MKPSPATSPASVRAQEPSRETPTPATLESLPPTPAQPAGQDQLYDTLSAAGLVLVLGVAAAFFLRLSRKR